MSDSRAEYAEMMVGYILANGPKTCDEVRIFCKERGITRGELKAARKELGVKTIKTKDTWLWSIPDRSESNE